MGRGRLMGKGGKGSAKGGRGRKTGNGIRDSRRVGTRWERGWHRL